ncbi:MAG TPA: hypothetical protein VK696_05295 [Steroidobacteraceae bacterium]|jgi:hypothetical protein|nr:hypothetical protein [Steroidobacteraceae bacterium]
MRRSDWRAVLLAAAVVTLPAFAQDSDNVADVRCVAVGIRAAELPNSTQKSTGTLLVLYYLGRLDGRNPTLDLEKLLAEQVAKMTDADYATESQRCSQSLSLKGAQITRLGEDLRSHFK